MAIMDALDILSDEQVITGSCYSQRAKYVGNPKDWGMGGLPRYVNIYAKGPCTIGTNMTFMVVGYSDLEGMSDVFPISQSQQFKKEDIDVGFAVSLPIPPVNKKYKYVAVQYVSDAGDDDADLAEDLCPVKPVLNDDEPVENCFSAFITFVPETDVEYMYSNYDKDVL